MGDLLGEDLEVISKDKLYRCLDQLLPHKKDLFSHLTQRWATLFQARFDILLLKIGAAKKDAGRVYALVDLILPKPGEPVNPQTFTFRLRKEKLRELLRREGCYLLRSNLTHQDPAYLWEYYTHST
jgi:hypothetical protein